MYASDITNRKRAETIYRNLELQKTWFASGGTIRILRQKGGNDYAYMAALVDGSISPLCNIEIPPLQITLKDGPVSADTTGMTPINFATYTSSDNGDTLQGSITLDDVNIPISTGGNDFYFFNVNAGATNTIWWNPNNAIFFGIEPNAHLVNFGPTTDASSNLYGTNSPCILLGNYDRRARSIYTSNYRTASGFGITKITTTFDDYYAYAQDASNNLIAPTYPIPTGTFVIRLIREFAGQYRQWIEVSVIESPPSPGYNTRISTYPSGTLDANGYAIDPTKNSPYDISDGTQLLHLCGTVFSNVSPASGTSFVFQSDRYGYNWVFTNHSFVSV